MILIILGFSFLVCNRLWHKSILSCVFSKLFLGLFKGESYNSFLWFGLHASKLLTCMKISCLPLPSTSTYSRENMFFVFVLPPAARSFRTEITCKWIFCQSQISVLKPLCDGFPVTWIRLLRIKRLLKQTKTERPGPYYVTLRGLHLQSFSFNFLPSTYLI